MIAYQTNADGVYVGTVVCDMSPLEPGVWLVPAGAYTDVPPNVEDDEVVVWADGGWAVVKVQPEPAPEPEPSEHQVVSSNRFVAYSAPDGPDTIFMRWQRGEATEQDWLDSVNAVKQANPYPS